MDESRYNMTQNVLDPATIASLGQKLDEFSEVLTPDEQAVMLGLLGIAEATIAASHEDADTEGAREVPFVSQPGVSKMPKMSATLKDTFRALPGMGLGDPGGPLADSVGVGWLCVSWSKDIDNVARGGAVMRVKGLRTTR